VADEGERQPALRIFSYLPNPRVYKALIAAEYGGIEVEVVGDKPSALADWLWDYDAHLLPAAQRQPGHPSARVSRRGFAGTLYKTDAFMRTQPFGTVPCAFGPAGSVGIFESNSILRAVARLGDCLYGADAYTASRIDSFLDANLVFAREAQVYLLAMDAMSEAVYTRMAAAYEFYLAGVENALGNGPWLAGKDLSIADISFVCDFAQFLREGHYEDSLAAAGYDLIGAQGAQRYPRAHQHMLALSELPEFARHMGSYLDWYKRKMGQLHVGESATD